MLSGSFSNCYGLKQFELLDIDFSQCNKALVYSPNGVMKSSLAQVFDDISKGVPSKDRIFNDVVSTYSVTYYGNQYSFSSDNPDEVPDATDKVYVIKTFTDSFEFTKETVGSLLADETTRNEYNTLMTQFSGEIRQVEEKLKRLSGLTKSQLKGKIITDFGLSEVADWPDIFERVNELIETRQVFEFLRHCSYKDLFNDKVLTIYQEPDFVNSIEEYIENLNALLSNNPILSNRFTDKNAEVIGREFEKNKFFDAQHTIRLKDGVATIRSIDEWNTMLGEQLEQIYSAPELSDVFVRLKSLLTANADASRLRDMISADREIIPALSDIESLKIQTWLEYFSNLDSPFSDYYEAISQYTRSVRDLYERAAAQSERWRAIVNEFNRRFRVPFEVQIENKANFLLKDEAPNISFVYKSGIEEQQRATLKKEDLMLSLSTGEKRALYLLYILFDLEKIRQQAIDVRENFLIIADDIADSFDYKNKYAIIEYLNDFGKTPGVDLLILTHNFDFYRTVKSRLGIKRSHCYIAQRNNEGVIYLDEFKYQKDFFKNVIIANIRDGNIDNEDKKKLLISSIPFYRNLCEYSDNETDYLKLTCFMHLKTQPLDTSSIYFSDLWNIIKPFLNNEPFCGADELYFDALIRIANACIADETNEVLLDNKLVIAIATRVCVEKFLKHKIEENLGNCHDAESNQTRKWLIDAEDFLLDEEKALVEEVLLITPENIHLNSFMYEPLIDVSDWCLKSLYRKVLALLEF